METYILNVSVERDVRLRMLFSVEGLVFLTNSIRRSNSSVRPVIYIVIIDMLTANVNASCGVEHVKAL